MAVYTGAETKIMLNSKGKRRKVSQIEQRLNRYLIVFLSLLVLSSLLCALLKMAADTSSSITSAWYLRDVNLSANSVPLLPPIRAEPIRAPPRLFHPVQTRTEQGIPTTFF